MARTIYYTASSVDGFIADQHNSLDWLVDTDHELPEDHPDHYDEFIKDIGALVMGSTTYEWVIEHEPSSLEKWGYEQPTWVCTHPTSPCRRRAGSSCSRATSSSCTRA